MLIQFNDKEINMFKTAFIKMQESQIGIYSLNLEDDKLYINDDYIVEYDRSGILFYAIRS